MQTLINPSALVTINIHGSTKTFSLLQLSQVLTEDEALAIIEECNWVNTLSDEERNEVCKESWASKENNLLLLHTAIYTLYTHYPAAYTALDEERRVEQAEAYQQNQLGL